MIATRRPILFLIAACLVLFSLRIGNRDFWNPDEPRYAGITRAMLESGDWTLLTDEGNAYTHKPPLLFWLAALSAWIGGGHSETTARLVPCLAALLCVLVTFRLGRELLGLRPAFLGAMVLATTQRFFLEARWLHTDTLLALFVVLALAGAHRGLSGRRYGWLGMYVALAMGCLAKGPVALALPAAGLLVALASRRETGRLKTCGWWWGLPLALTPTALWLLAGAQRAGFDPLEVVGVQIFQRFQEGLHHPRPLYYYFYALPLAFLPWTLFFPGTLVTTLPFAESRSRAGLLFLYGWIVGGLALLSLSVEKRPSYLLPILPALALLVGAFLDNYLTRFDATPIRRLLTWPLAAGGIASLGGAIWLVRWDREFPGAAARGIPLAAFLLLVCAAASWAIRRGKRGAAVVTLVAGFGLLLLGIVVLIFPWLNHHKSARPFSVRINSTIGSALLGIYADPNPAFAYYTNRPLRILRRPEEVAAFLAAPAAGYCLMQEGEYEALAKEIPLRRIDGESVGHRRYVLAAGAESPHESVPPQASPSPR